MRQVKFFLQGNTEPQTHGYPAEGRGRTLKGRSGRSDTRGGAVAKVGGWVGRYTKVGGSGRWVVGGGWKD